MGSVRSLCCGTTSGRWGPGQLGCATRPRTLADDELLHAVLELGCAAQPPGRALQSILPLGELRPQRCNLTLEHLLLGQGRVMSSEHRPPCPARAPAPAHLALVLGGAHGQHSAPEGSEQRHALLQDAVQGAGAAPQVPLRRACPSQGLQEKGAGAGAAGAPPSRCPRGAAVPSTAGQCRQHSLGWRLPASSCPKASGLLLGSGAT